MECLKDLVKYMETNKDAIAFYDGTNCDKKRRSWVKDYLKKHVPQTGVIFIESICNNEDVVSYNVEKSKVPLSDFFGISPEQAYADFYARIKLYEKQYQVLEKTELDGKIRYVKVIDGGRSMEVHRMGGHVGSLAIQFLMNIRLNGGPIYITSPGETESLGVKIGGNPCVTENSKKYGQMIDDFFKKEADKWLLTGYSKCKLFFSPSTSCSQIEQRLTFKKVNCVRESPFLLNRIDYGDCDGMKLKKLIKEYGFNLLDSHEQSRSFRYPSGESYDDLIQRLEPFIMELMRIKDPVVIIAHPSIVSV